MMKEATTVSQELVLGIYVFIMAMFVGFEVISRVPSVLHTPLMSGTNAIHGIVISERCSSRVLRTQPLLKVLGFIAVVFGAANTFGGFVVTDQNARRCSASELRRKPAENKNA
jgi:NAD(P) transhydrogenase subunit alpha